jgi:NYN domain
LDRCAIFVDAGYLLAEAGNLCLGTKKRRDIVCDYEGVHAALRQRGQFHCGLPPLRTYWYDGAAKGIPTSDHEQIAALPTLKLRLGRLSGSKQKGVDSLIFRDLLTLARERAISTAFILAGDEDLREAVLAVQDLGIQIVLWGIESLKPNQASTLVHECDEHDVLEIAFWLPFFTSPIKPTVVDTFSEIAPTTSPEDIPYPRLVTIDAATADAAANTPQPTAGTPPSQPDAVEIGYTLGSRWLDEADPLVIGDVLQALPFLPIDVDAPMLRGAERLVGSLRLRGDLRRAIRDGFVKRLREETSNVSR